jgi:23S rRNA pseudouridine1911/1915/1917 synthase
MEYIINEKQDKILLRDFLRRELKLSARLVKSLKKYENSILVNGEHSIVTKRLSKGDVVTLDFTDKEEDVNEYLEKTDIPLDIIYEDENFTVVNKSSNMPTHQSLRHYTDTLANALAFRYKDRPYVFRAINRLDMDTSGVVVTANNRFYADFLCEKLQNGGFHKQYIAIVEGKLEGEGTIDAPIIRLEESIIKRGVSSEGDESITNYKVLMSSDSVSVVLVTPITGRTHQIRVHMAHIGHPIIGDFLYGKESDEMKRQALHAYRLDIDGVGSFEAKLPEDMQNLIRRYFGDDKGIS